MNPNTTTRTALVTGASRGIGRAIAVALGGRGFKVIVNFLANAHAAVETVELVRQAGGDALAVQADVGNAEARASLVKESLDFLGRIDVLVNNAGIPPARRDDLLDATEDIYDRVMDTNLKGPFFLTQLVAREWVRGPGSGVRSQASQGHDQEIDVNEAASAPPGSTMSSTPDSGPRTPDHFPRLIINLNSLSAYAASTHRSQYCIAKAGMTMMTQLFAARLANDGVQVFELRPGIIDTDMARNAKEKYDKLIHEGGLLPMERWGKPEDVARAVLAIVDDHFPYSTGAVFDIDGGYHIRRL